ncbi:lactosylceramide 4-alpha-galactosyltransferase-like [Spodoptera litura]|uniref:Lactosylceramide 4-alpha-galactosyltransferase-like n=1 Tax=Spodoptera litura TaxID=69820 RepID=A0A9J7DM87_SPOLT|nr:lactosylceramide 4-alpha-galactosyltransferase-like [Spodoptera litura]
MYSLKAQKKKCYLRKNVIFLIIFILFSSVTIYYVNLRDVSAGPPYIMRSAHRSNVNNLSCHYDDEGDVLPWAEGPNFSPKFNSIFFHETSCRGGLNSRQACSIESAARAHPRRQIYVLFSGPIMKLVYQRSCIAKLRLLPNVHFARVHIEEYAKNTPLDGLVASNEFKESKWRIEHTSDVLRYLTLYKWGGVYLDTDIMVVKSLTPLGHNWVAKEDNGLVNAAAIAISMDHLGRRLAKTIVNEVKTTYRPDVFIHNGPGAITRVLHHMCNKSDPNEWSANTCQGLEVYGPEYFYPVHYTRNNDYFKPGTLRNVANAYTHHLWNKITYNTTIEKDSPYEKMAQQLCPLIYEMYGDEFGT